MKQRNVILIGIVLVTSLVVSIAVFAATSITQFTVSSTSCNSSFGIISASWDTPTAWETGQVSLADGTVLFSFAHGSSGQTNYTGSYSFGGWSAQPVGTTIYLSATMGQSSPTAANTVEFSAAYQCGTGRVLSSCYGPYGYCANTSGSGSPSMHDGRLNNSDAWDVAAPIVLYKTDTQLTVYGVGSGQSDLLFSVDDADLVAGEAAVIATATISSTGQPVVATLQSDGTLLLEAHYADGKPYTIIYQPNVSPAVVHVAW